MAPGTGGLVSVASTNHRAKPTAGAVYMCLQFRVHTQTTSYSLTHTAPVVPLPYVAQDQGPDNQGQLRYVPKPAGIIQSSPS